MNRTTYVITLNWNTTELLRKMVRSVDRTMAEEHRWIIVENGSNEENRVALYNWIHRYLPGDFVMINVEAGIGNGWNWNGDIDGLEAVILSSEENLGCIRGHNLAFDMARLLSGGRAHEIVMVNTDVVITEKGWLTKVREWAEGRPKVGIVGLEHNRIEVGAPAIFLDTNGNWYIQGDQPRRAEPVEGESVGLGLALIRWPVLKAGLRFDPGFKMYYKQDDDLCFQMRAELGLEVWAFPIGCVHWGSGSLKANEYKCGDARGWDEFDQMKQANQRHFAEKWRWALRDRRRSLEEEARHLAQMKQVMEERRCESLPRPEG